MTYGSYAVTAALTLSVLGMMLVIGGVLTSGLFLPGVVLLALSLIGYAIAGVLHTRASTEHDGTAGGAPAGAADAA